MFGCSIEYAVTSIVASQKSFVCLHPAHDSALCVVSMWCAAIACHVTIFDVMHGIKLMSRNHGSIFSATRGATVMRQTETRGGCRIINHHQDPPEARAPVQRAQERAAWIERPAAVERMRLPPPRCRPTTVSAGRGG